MTKMHVALIPAYEPDEKLIELVEELKDNNFVVVVVNDGSGEEYDRTFSKLIKKAVVLNHSENRGKGVALRTGLSYIKTCFGRRCVVVTLDADGQHTVSDAIKICNAASLSERQLVLGVRDFKGEVPFRSRFGNEITRTVYRLFTGTKLKDTQTGLRAFSGDMIDELLCVRGDRYEYEMNMLLECSAAGVDIKEIDIETIYEGNNEVSHFEPFSDSFLIYKEILKFCASSFLSFLIDYFMYVVIYQVTGWMGLANSVVLSNVLSRVVSGTFNYTVNKKAVFESDDGVAASAARYVMLALCVLAANTGLLYVMSEVIGINAYLAKVLAECLMFLFSYTAQRTFVFHREKRVLA